MNKRWSVLIALLLVSVLLLAAALGCSQAKPSTPTPTPTAKATPTPTPTPTAKATPTPTPTPAAAPFYQGKTIDFVITAKAGGSLDLQARVMAKYLPAFIPGKPTIVVRNMSAGGGQEAMNHVYNIAKPDGLTVSLNARMHHDELFLDKPPFKTANMPFIAATTKVWMVFASTSIPGLKKPEDIVGKEVVFGAPSGPKGLQGYLIADFLGIKVKKTIFGYSGIEQLVGTVAGELNFGMETSSDWYASVLPYVKEGKIMPLFQTGYVTLKGDLTRFPGLADYQTFLEFYEQLYGKGKLSTEKQKLLDLTKACLTESSGHAVVMSVAPGVPQDRIDILRKAVKDLCEDKTFQEDENKMFGTVPPWFFGEDGQKALDASMKVMRENLDFFKAYYQ